VQPVFTADQMRRVDARAIAERGIAVEINADPGVVVVEVRDDGPGIPADARDKLFLSHYSTKQRGSGVGLAIVRRIVDEHGGRIEVTENTPSGTRFAIELPC